MKCTEYDIVAFLKGELAPEERETAVKHFDDCSRCTRELARIDRVVKMLGRVERVAPTPGFKWRVREAFVREHPEFLEPARRARGQDLGWWASLKAQFQFVPAWAFSIAAHILLFAVLAILLFSPEDPAKEEMTRIQGIRDKHEGLPPDWKTDWNRAGGGKGSRGIGARHDERPRRDFTHDPERGPNIHDPRHPRPPRRTLFDPKGWLKETVVEIDNRLLAFLKSRTDSAIKDRLRAEAGGVDSRKSVASALSWLASKQHEDGYWPAPIVEQHRFRIGVTGLALLAFLADGNSHQSGKYKEQVALGLKYLCQQQLESGLIGDPDSNYMYDHAIAATALLEAYLLTRDEELLRYRVTAAVMFTIRAQNSRGGWGYVAGDNESDTSVMGWQVILLRLYRAVEKHGPTTALNQANVRLLLSTNKKDGRVGYRGQGQYPHREFAMTAVGMFTHMMARPFVDDQLMDLQADVLLAEGNPKVQVASGGYRKNDLYFWHFGSLALYQKGGQAWKVWNERLQDYSARGASLTFSRNLLYRFRASLRLLARDLDRLHPDLARASALRGEIGFFTDPRQAHGIGTRLGFDVVV